MHADGPLTDLERRLADWIPADDGLSADAMLFAAGRAAARRGAGRWAWLATTAGLAVLSGVLAGRLRNERSQRIILAPQLDGIRAAPSGSLEIAMPPVLSEAANLASLPDDSYLFARRALSEGLEAWPPRMPPAAPSLPGRPVLRAGDTDVPES